MRALFATGLACLAPGIFLLLPALSFNPSQHGANVFAIHCIANGVILFAVWYLHQDRSVEAGYDIPRLIAVMVAYGLGVVDLFLAGAALFNLSYATAQLIPLVIPGALGWHCLSLSDYAKKAVADDVQDEVALADPAAGPDEDKLSWAAAARASGFAGLFYFFYLLAFMGGIALGACWYYIVWYSVSEDIAFDPWRIVSLLASAVGSQGTYILAICGMLTALVVVMGIGSFVWSRFKKRLPRSPLPPGEQTEIEQRLRAIWAYTNRPERKAMGWPTWSVGSLIFGTAIAAGFLLLIYNDSIALWILRIHHEPKTVWSIFSASIGSFFFGLLGLVFWAWSLWLFIMNRWPGVPEALATGSLQRSNPNISIGVGEIRCALKKILRRGDVGPFDAREFLLKRWRRFTRGVYIFTLVVTPVCLWGTWASLNTYTLISPAGIEDHDAFFGGTVVHPYEDVRKVEIRCTVNRKGDTQFSWQAIFADHTSLNLFREVDIERSFAALVKVDAILRGYGVTFEVTDPDTGRSTVEDECLEKLSDGVPDRSAFLRFMHHK